MSDFEHYRCKADLLLRQAAVTSNMKERSQLIDEAMHWHKLASNALAHPDKGFADNDEGEDGLRAG